MNKNILANCGIRDIKHAINGKQLNNIPRTHILSTYSQHTMFSPFNSNQFRNFTRVGTQEQECPEQSNLTEVLLFCF